MSFSQPKLSVAVEKSLRSRSIVLFKRKGFAVEYFLAMAFFYSPVEIPMYPQMFRKLQPALRQLVFDLEIIDEKESYFIAYGNYKKDLRSLRHWKRRLDICPSTSERDYFPDVTAVKEVLKFNRQSYQFLLIKQRCDPYHWDYYQTLIMETEKLHTIWEKLEFDNHGDDTLPYISQKRERLRSIKEFLGDENFYKRQLPPPVPIWAFEELQ